MSSPEGFLLVAGAAFISWVALTGEYLWKEVRPRLFLTAPPGERFWTRRLLIHLVIYTVVIAPIQLVMIFAITEPEWGAGAFGRGVAILELAAAGLWLLLSVVYIRADARKNGDRS